jgi:sarcosine oxidase, subunit gamma
MDKLVARTVIAPLYVAESKFPIQLRSLQISEVPLAGIIRLQGRTDDEQFRTSVNTALGLQLPKAERTAQNGDIRLAWSGPNEYLCFCPLEIEEGLLKSITEALAGQFAVATLYSDSRVGFRIVGDEATGFISKGCSIDVHAATFPVGQCVTTKFAGLPAMLMHRMDGEYVVYFDVGYIEFVLKWLVDAAEEFSEQVS